MNDSLPASLYERYYALLTDDTKPETPETPTNEDPESPSDESFPKKISLLPPISASIEPADRCPANASKMYISIVGPRETRQQRKAAICMITGRDLEIFDMTSSTTCCYYNESHMYVIYRETDLDPTRMPGMDFVVFVTSNQDGTTTPDPKRYPFRVIWTDFPTEAQLAKAGVPYKDTITSIKCSFYEVPNTTAKPRPNAGNTRYY